MNRWCDQQRKYLNIKVNNVIVTPCSVSSAIRQSPYTKGYLTQHQKQTSEIQGLAYISKPMLCHSPQCYHYLLSKIGPLQVIFFLFCIYRSVLCHQISIEWADLLNVNKRNYFSSFILFDNFRMEPWIVT